MVMVLGGCDGPEASGESSSSESTGIDSSEGDTFSEEGSSSGGPAFADGEMFGRCEANDDCVGFDGSDSPTTTCRARTCVALTRPTTETGITPSWLGGDWSCPDVEAAPVPTAWKVGQSSSGVCGLRARVAEGLGYCPDGMTLATFHSDVDTLSSSTCWWSPEVVSGTICSTDNQCGGCGPQPYEAGGLPNICY